MEDKVTEAWRKLVDAYAVAYDASKKSSRPNFNGVYDSLNKFNTAFGNRMLGRKTAEKDEKLKALAAEYSFPQKIDEKQKAALRQKLKGNIGYERVDTTLLEKTFNIATAEPAVGPEKTQEKSQVDPLDAKLSDFQKLSVEEISALLKESPNAAAKINQKFKEHPHRVAELINANPINIAAMLEWNLSVVNSEITHKGFDQKVLFQACEKGNLPIVEFLVNKNKNLLSFKNSDGQNPFSVACSHGQLDVVKLLSGGSDVNSADKNGLTPLAHACKGGHADIVESLIQTQRVDINAEDRNGHRPLDYACMQGKANVVHALLKAGAEPTQEAFDFARALGARDRKASGAVSVLLTEAVIARRQAKPKVKEKYDTGLAENDRAVLAHEIQDFFSRQNHSTDLKNSIKSFFDKVDPKYKVYALDVMIKTGSPAVINALVDNQQDFFSKAVYGRQFNKSTYLMHTEMLERKLIENQQNQKGLQASPPQARVSQVAVQPAQRNVTLIAKPVFRK